MGEWEFAVGRSGAFLMGSIFSALVGLCGMMLATTGNLRVAAAARHSYGEAMQLGYRTGTVTGMLTDGLGLLGGTCIFLVYGERAYEALLGFGFGGTLLALFMRVGGGIYTKAADVGADLVGKVEAGIPEDDPRNAATIADNVGDNVGDCAGMAADIFESYEVTIVAAMILGLASFGHKGVIFPLLVRGIGVLGSIISTYTVKAGPNDTSDTALKSVHRGFWIGSAISVFGFVVLGFAYLRISDDYIREYPQAIPGYKTSDKFNKAQDVFTQAAKTASLNASEQAAAFRDWLKAGNEGNPIKVEHRDDKGEARLVELKSDDEPLRGYEGKGEDAGILAAKQSPLANVFGVDTRPILTCFIGIMLAIVLNKLTSYYTHTTHPPVKSLVRACQTGHATNIIQGLAVGYESAVMATLVLAAAIALSVFCYTGASPVFIAYGVAMAGIGMLTLTGNTISMDVFGPVADNANGIGEMGYNKDTNGQDLKAGQPGYMAPADYQRARQILADLDAVGNTTKAETKGIAIGSAVIAAVSLFASFIAALAMGSEDKITEMTTQRIREVRVAAYRGQPEGVHRPLDRRRRSLALQFDADSCRGTCGLLHHQGVPHPVSRQGDNGRHEEARLWPRGRYLHQRRPGRIDRPRPAGRAQPDPRRRASRSIRPGRFPGRHDPLGRDARGVHGQRRRRLGQRQEDDRGRAQGSGPQPGQGIGEAQGGRHRRHRRRSVKGHGRPCHQSAGQGDEHGRHAHTDKRGALLQSGGRQELADREGTRRLDRRHHRRAVCALDRLGRQEVEHRHGRDEGNRQLHGRR